MILLSFVLACGLVLGEVAPPDTYVIAQARGEEAYTVQRVQIGEKQGNQYVSSLTPILDDQSKSQYLSQESVQLCNAVSSEGDRWHMLTVKAEYLALLTVELDAKNESTIHTLYPKMPAQMFPMGCVWYDDKKELVMMTWTTALDGSTEYFFTGIDVESGKTRAITSWNSGAETVAYGLGSIDSDGHLYLTNIDKGGNEVLVVDASLSNVTFADALVANSTVSLDGVLVAAMDDDVVFVSDVTGDGKNMTIGSSSRANVLKGGKRDIIVSTPLSWIFPDDTGTFIVKIVDDSTMLFLEGSPTAGPNSTATFHLCSIELPAVDDPGCSKVKTLNTMVWTLVTVPASGSWSGGSIAAVVISCLVAVALLSVLAFYLRRRYGKEQSYIEI